VNRPGVAPIELFGEVRATEEIVAAPRATLVFVAKLADLDGPVGPAFHFDPEIDPVAAKVAWIQRVDGTAVPAGFRLCRGSHCHGTPE
jgi:hypothetical protein